MKYSLREWQREALVRWQENWRGILSVVTGGGKTVFAEAAIMAFGERFRNGRTVIVVPTSALLDQWYLSLTDELGVGPDQISTVGGGERGDLGRPIVIAIINSARTTEALKDPGGRPSLLIVDECHRAGSPENAKALSGEYEAALGLSATPEREYDEGFVEFVQPALGPVIYEYDYAAAYADGIITPFSLHNVRVPLIAQEEEEYARLSRRIAQIASRPDTDEERLKILLQRRAAISANAVYRIPVAVRVAEQFRGERTIIFHERTDAADLIAERLVAKSHSVAVYHSGVPAPLRRESLRLFRRGVYDVLICCRALDEGMNVPETSLAIVASGTASARQRIQRLGRILRPAKGKDKATVYTLYATDEEERRLETEESALHGVADTTWHRSAGTGP